MREGNMKSSSTSHSTQSPTAPANSVHQVPWCQPKAGLVWFFCGDTKLAHRWIKVSVFFRLGWYKCTQDSMKYGYLMDIWYFGYASGENCLAPKVVGPEDPLEKTAVEILEPSLRTIGPPDAVFHLMVEKNMFGIEFVVIVLNKKGRNLLGQKL